MSCKRNYDLHTIFWTRGPHSKKHILKIIVMTLAPHTPIPRRLTVPPLFSMYLAWGHICQYYDHSTLEHRSLLISRILIPLSASGKISPVELPSTPSSPKLVLNSHPRQDPPGLLLGLFRV